MDVTPLAHVANQVFVALAKEIESQGCVRHELYRTLSSADEDDVAAVLHDLVESRLAFSSGRGAATVFGLTSDVDRARLLDV